MVDARNDRGIPFFGGILFWRTGLLTQSCRKEKSFLFFFFANLNIWCTVHVANRSLVSLSELLKSY